MVLGLLPEEHGNSSVASDQKSTEPLMFALRAVNNWFLMKSVRTGQARRASPQNNLQASCKLHFVDFLETKLIVVI